MNAIDLDNDGLPEIIASYGCGLQAVAFQAFKRSASGLWFDATDALVGNQSVNTALSDGWCYKIEVQDLNNDGYPDVICQSVRGLATPVQNVFWFGGKKLEFSGATLQNGAWVNFSTVVRNKDGLYILGIKYFRDQPDLTIRRWKLR